MRETGLPVCVLAPTIEMSYVYRWSDGATGSGTFFLAPDGTFSDAVGHTGVWVFSETAQRYYIQYDAGQFCRALFVGQASDPTMVQGAMLWQAIRTATPETEYLRTFMAPVYVAVGTCSHPGFRATAEALVSLFPHASLGVYEGADHFEIHARYADRLAASLRTLWTQEKISQSVGWTHKPGIRPHWNGSLSWFIISIILEIWNLRKLPPSLLPYHRKRGSISCAC